MNPTPLQTALLGAALGLALACALYFGLSCTLPVPSPRERVGVPVDLCDLCWNGDDAGYPACGNASNDTEARLCSIRCTEVCNVLRKDGGA